MEKTVFVDNENVLLVLHCDKDHEGDHEILRSMRSRDPLDVILKRMLPFEKCV